MNSLAVSLVDEKLFKTTIRRYTDLWRKIKAARRLTYVGPPHSVRHSGPSRDHLLGSRTLSEIEKRGRWKSLISVYRYSKGHVYVSQLARQPAHIRAAGETLMAQWGVRRKN